MRRRRRRAGQKGGRGLGPSACPSACHPWRSRRSLGPLHRPCVSIELAPGGLAALSPRGPPAGRPAAAAGARRAQHLLHLLALLPRAGAHLWRGGLHGGHRREAAPRAACWLRCAVLCYAVLGCRPGGTRHARRGLVATSFPWKEGIEWRRDKEEEHRRAAEQPAHPRPAPPKPRRGAGVERGVRDGGAAAGAAPVPGGERRGPAGGDHQGGRVDGAGRGGAGRRGCAARRRGGRGAAGLLGRSAAGLCWDWRRGWQAGHCCGQPRLGRLGKGQKGFKRFEQGMQCGPQRKRGGSVSGRRSCCRLAQLWTCALRSTPHRRRLPQVLGTPSREEIHAMNPNYTEFKFPQVGGAAAALGAVLLPRACALPAFVFPARVRASTLALQACSCPQQQAQLPSSAICRAARLEESA